MRPQSLSNGKPDKQEAVKFVPARILLERGKEIHKLIERRAYEIFVQRGCAPGLDVDDWLWAESELLYPCRHALKESPEAIVLHAELPGVFTANQLEVSIEPRRLMISGETKVDAIYGDDKGGNMQRVPERIFRVHDLPVEVDPSKATATLSGEVLEIVLPKVTAASNTVNRVKAAEQGG